MAAPQPKNEEDRASVEGLDEVFTKEACDAGEDLTDKSMSQPKVEELFDEINEDDEEEGITLQSRVLEDEGTVNDTVSEKAKRSVGTAVSKAKETKLTSSIVDGEDRVSRSDLVSLLEGFLGVLKGNAEIDLSSGIARVQPEELKFTDVDVEDRTAELEDMRRLVVEAQDTIIKLLTDRVEDRAKIAQLETELKLLPDLQEQADRAMAVAFKTEEFRTDLQKVKYELEMSRLESIRRDMYIGPKGLVTRVQRWLIKAKGRSLLHFNESLKRGERPE